MSIVVLTTMILFKIALKESEIILLKLIELLILYKKTLCFGKFIFGDSCLDVVFAIFLWSFSTQPILQSYFKGITTLSVEVFNFKLIIWPLNYIFFAIVFVTISFWSSYFFGLLLYRH